MRSLLAILFMLLLLHSGKAMAQMETDSVNNTLNEKEVEEEHSPTKAAKYSAILPGLGQVYNKKYWKVPILYAGGGLLVYFYRDNNDFYKRYRDALIHRQGLPENGTPTDEFRNIYSERQLQTLRDSRRRDRDFTVIVSVLAYVINILDAYVDAHLWEFDMSDDLSIKLEPTLIPGIPQQNFGVGVANSTPGISIRMSLR